MGGFDPLEEAFNCETANLLDWLSYGRDPQVDKLGEWNVVETDYGDVFRHAKP